LGTAEFAYNNKIHLVTKVPSFKGNYGQDLQMGFKERKKGKFETAEKFIEKIKKIQKEIKVVLEKTQEEIKKYTNRKWKEEKEYKVGDLVLLSMKDHKW